MVTRKGICPKCGQPLTIGVEYRVEELTDQSQEEFNKKPYYKMLPLHELIVLSNGSSLNSKKTWQTYNHILEKFGSEFEILLNAKKEDLARVMDEKLIGLVIKNREGKIKVKPGYDGEYGIALLDEKQKTLF